MSKTRSHLAIANTCEEKKKLNSITTIELRLLNIMTMMEPAYLSPVR